MSTWFGSSAQATDRRIGATDQSQVVQGRGQIINPGGVAFGAKSGNTTYKIGKGGSVTITSGVPAAELSGLVNNIVQASSDQINALRETLGDQIGAAQSQIGALAKTAQQTDDEKKNKSVTWIALAALGLVALFVMNNE